MRESATRCELAEELAHSAIGPKVAFDLWSGRRGILSGCLGAGDGAARPAGWLAGPFWENPTRRCLYDGTVVPALPARNVPTLEDFVSVLSRILCPVDFSELAVSTRDLAVALAPSRDGPAGPSMKRTDRVERARFHDPRIHDPLIRRVVGEYREMPGLNPSLAQAQRLFGLDDTTCRTVLEALVEARFLSRNHRGQYVRRDGAP